jgi:hypothetical protein
MKKKINPRRTFSVKGQLVGKLGPRGYGRLVEQFREAGLWPEEEEDAS